MNLQILNRLKKTGGIKTENMPLLFEIRFAFEIYNTGLVAEYEYKAGVGNSTVEFRIQGASDWLIELVSIRPSKAAKNAIRKFQPYPGIAAYEQIIRSNASNCLQTPEAEMIKVEEKIGEKVFSNGKPTKFPIPKEGFFHLILTDVRGYLDGAGRYNPDYDNIAYGNQGTSPDNIHYWEIIPGKKEPIKGLFEKSNPLNAAKYIQKRIHFLGFIYEEKFQEGEIRYNTYYIPNIHLLKNYSDIKQAWEIYPLKNKQFN